MNRRQFIGLNTALVVHSSLLYNCSVEKEYSFDTLPLEKIIYEFDEKEGRFKKKVIEVTKLVFEENKWSKHKI